MENRCIVDALVDLGEKVTGKEIDVKGEEKMLYGEDITEVIDAITENYSAGGGGGETTKANIWYCGELAEPNNNIVLDKSGDDYKAFEGIFEEFNYAGESTGKELPITILFDTQTNDQQREVKGGTIYRMVTSSDGATFSVYAKLEDVIYRFDRDFFTEQWTMYLDSYCSDFDRLVIREFASAEPTIIERADELLMLNKVNYNFSNYSENLPTSIMFEWGEGTREIAYADVLEIYYNNDDFLQINAKVYSMNNTIAIIFNDTTNTWAISTQ